MARELLVRIIGDDASLQRALSRSSAETNTFASRMSAAGAKLRSTGRSMTMGMTLPIVGIGVVAGKTAMDFQSAMELLSTQANVPQRAIAGLSKSVLGLAGPTATAPDTLAAGLYHLTSQGLKGAKSLHALQIAAEGAKMGQANLEDVTNALGAVLSSKIAGVHSYEQAMGQLNATVGAGDMRMQDLADAMGTGLPANAAVAHVSLLQVNAALATLGDNNIRGAKAGTLLNSTMRVLGHQSTAGISALKDLGVNSDVLQAKLSKTGLTGAIDYLTERIKASGKSTHVVGSDLSEAFGGKQATGIKILIDQIGRLHTKVSEISKGGASFEANWTKYTHTTAYHFDRMGATMRAAGISIGDILLPIVSKVVNGLASLLNKFQALPDSVKKTILVFAGALAVAGPLTSILGMLAETIGFLAANPIVIAIAGVAALAAAMVAAEKAPKELKALLEKLGFSSKTATSIVHGLRTAFHALVGAGKAIVAEARRDWPAIKSVIHNTVGVIKSIISGAVDLIKGVWGTFGGGLKTIAKADWNFIKNTIHNDLTVIKGVIEIVTGLITGNWHKVWKGIKDVVRGTLNQVKNILVTEKNILIGVAKLIGEGLRTMILKPLESLASSALSVLKKVGNAIGNGISAGLHAVSENWKKMIDTVLINPINWLIGKLNSILSFHLPSWIPGVGGKGFSLGLPLIPKLDTGGLVLKTGLAVVHRGETFSGVGAYARQPRPALAGPGAGITFAPVTTINIGGRRVYSDTHRQARRAARRGNKVTINAH